MTKAKTKPATFGSRLAALIEADGRSVAAIAEAAEMSRQTIYQLLRDLQEPAWSTVDKLAAALEISTDEFRK